VLMGERRETPGTDQPPNPAGRVDPARTGKPPATARDDDGTARQ